MEPQSSSVRIVVVGGANTDIVGRPFMRLLERDSNPGYVKISSGGVGRNIAENLAALGFDVELVTAMGGDHNAAELMARCHRAGIGLTHTMVSPELPGSLYMAILDDGGDMVLALNDMRALDRLTPATLIEARPTLTSAAVVVADTNLSEEVLGWLAENVTVPLVLDTVSVAKAPRGEQMLDRLAAVKCTGAEAAVLLGREEPRGADELGDAAQALHERGVRQVFLTAGHDGTFYVGPDSRGHLRAPRVGVANATGAGDAFTAGVAAGIAEGLDIRSCAAFGTSMAGLTLASEHTVSDHISRGVVSREMERINA